MAKYAKIHMTSDNDHKRVEDSKATLCGIPAEFGISVTPEDVKDTPEDAPFYGVSCLRCRRKMRNRGDIGGANEVRVARLRW